MKKTITVRTTKPAVHHSAPKPKVALTHTEHARRSPGLRLEEMRGSTDQAGSGSPRGTQTLWEGNRPHHPKELGSSSLQHLPWVWAQCRNVTPQDTENQPSGGRSKEGLLRTTKHQDIMES